MKTSTFFLLAAAVAAAVYLLGKPANTAKTDAPVLGPGDAPVVNVVEETLHRHEGEDNPVVHAFEEASAHTHDKAPG